MGMLKKAVCISLLFLISCAHAMEKKTIEVVVERTPRDEAGRMIYAKTPILHYSINDLTSVLDLKRALVFQGRFENEKTPMFASLIGNGDFQDGEAYLLSDEEKLVDIAQMAHRVSIFSTIYKKGQKFKLYGNTPTLAQ